MRRPEVRVNVSDNRESRVNDAETQPLEPKQIDMILRVDGKWKMWRI